MHFPCAEIGKQEIRNIGLNNIRSQRKKRVHWCTYPYFAHCIVDKTKAVEPTGLLVCVQHISSPLIGGGLSKMDCPKRRVDCQRPKLLRITRNRHDNSLRVCRENGAQKSRSSNIGACDTASSPPNITPDEARTPLFCAAICAD